MLLPVWTCGFRRGTSSISLARGLGVSDHSAQSRFLVDLLLARTSAIWLMVILSWEATSVRISLIVFRAYLLTRSGQTGISPRLSLSGDFLGQTLINAKRISASTFTDFFQQNTVSNISPISQANVNQASIAAGAKIDPLGKLLITVNVLFRVNDAGLHSKPVPLVGLSYTF